MLGQRGRRIAGRVRTCALACAFALAAQAADADSADPRARAIFDALHVEREVAEIAAQAASSVALPAHRIPPADALLLHAAVATCFDAERLAALALGSFSAHLDAAYAPAVLEWLARPETQELLLRTTAEPPGSEPGDARAGAYTEAGARDRDALLLRFERRSGHAARAGRQAALVFAAMLRAANPLLPPLQRYDPAELDLLSSRLRERLGAGPADASELRRRYVGIPTQQLASALAFLESPAGAWLQREVDAALERALVRAARATAARLVGALRAGSPELPVRIARLAHP